MMMTNKRIQQWILGSIVGGAIGLALACNDDQDNARDCWNADGDATCAELFGGERPFCTTDAQPCGAQAELGCVAQRPELDECYSPCGRGQSLLDNPACGTADSGDTDTTGTPDDFDEGGAGCGNGEVDDGEECDDGNEVADDSCTNACMSPRCGDGIVQLGVGEVCDDGGIEPGDGCTISCQLRGAMVGDVNSELMEVGRAVVVDSQDHVTVSGTALGLSWLAKFDAGLEPQWDRDALGSGLALGPADQLLIGGSLLAQAQSQQIQADGTELWSDGLANKPSSFSAVAMVEGHAVSVGYRNLMNKVGLLVRHDVSTGAILSTADWQDGPLGPVAVDQSGWVWAIGDGANPELHIYDESDNLVHMMPLEPGIYEDLALDQQGSVHLLARAEDHSSFTVTKLCR